MADGGSADGAGTHRQKPWGNGNSPRASSARSGGGGSAELLRALQAAITSAEVCGGGLAVGGDGEANGECELLEAARAELRTFLASEKLERAIVGDSIDELQAALCEAEAAGLQDSETLRPLERGHAALAALRRLTAARTKLRRGLPLRQRPADAVAWLNAAVGEADAIGLEGAEVEEARSLLAAEAKKIAAQERVVHALRTCEMEALREAVLGARSVGLVTPELERAARLLAVEEERRAVRTALVWAIQCRDVEALRLAIQDAQVAVSAASVADLAADATKVLEEEERLIDARASLRRHSLQVGQREGSLEELQASIEEGRAAGLTPWELEAARALANFEVRRSAARARLEEALRAALREGLLVGLDPHETQSASEVLTSIEYRQDLHRELEVEAKNRSIEGMRFALRKLQEGKFEEDGDWPEAATARKVLAVEERRAQALENLRLAGAKSEENALQVAVDEAVKAGVDSSEVERAQVTLTFRVWKVNARQALDEAVKKAEVVALRNAITDAEAVHLSPAEIQEARTKLEACQRRDEASARLARALEDESNEALRTAINEGRTSGVAAEELARASRRLAARDQFEVMRAEVEMALRSKHSAELREAISRAEAMKFTGVELIAARRALAQNTALQVLRDELPKARESWKVGPLEVAVRDVEGLGMDCKEVDDARDLFARARRRDDAMGLLAAAVRKSDVQGLRAAINEAKAVGIDGHLVKSAELKLTEVEKAAVTHAETQRHKYSQQIKDLRVAVRRYHAAGVKGFELEAAQEALEQEERRSAAFEGIEFALRRPLIPLLQVAIEEAEAAGLHEDELTIPRDVLATATLHAEISADLRSALQRRNLEGLRAATARARDCAFVGPEFNDARTALSVEQQKTNALEALTNALQAGEFDEVRHRVRRAHAMCIEGPQVDHAVQSLAREEERLGSQFDLDKAMKAQMAEPLKVAIERMERFTGVAHSEARARLYEIERRADAVKSLNCACSTGDPETLKAAIAQGEAAGLEFFETEHARLIMLASERRRKTLGELRRAIAAGSVTTLQLVIDDALALGIKDGEELAEAQSALVAEQPRSEARRRIFEADERRDPTLLREAIRAGEVAKLPCEELARTWRRVAALEQRRATDAVVDCTMHDSRAQALKAVIKSLEAALNRIGGSGGEELDLARRALIAEERRAAAVHRLRAVLDGNSNASLDDLRAAVQEGRHAGLQLSLGFDANLYERSRQILMAQEWLISARAELVRSMEVTDVGLVKFALAGAEAAGCQVAELQLARSFLAVEKRRTSARDTLCRAVYRFAEIAGGTRVDEGGSDGELAASAAASLRVAIDDGRVAGVEASELERAEIALTIHARRNKSAQALQEAMLEEDVSALRRPILEAQAVGLDSQLLSNAVRRLETELEGRERANVRRDLAQAVAGRKVGELRAALDRASWSGYVGDEVVAATELMFSLEKVARAMERLRCALVAGRVIELRSAVETCEALNVSGTEMKVARDALAAEERRRALLEMLLSAMQARSVEVLPGAIKNFLVVAPLAPEITEAQLLLAELRSNDRRMATLVELQRALQGRDIASLRLAIAHAEATEFQDPLLLAARDTLAEVEAKAYEFTSPSDVRAVQKCIRFTTKINEAVPLQDALIELTRGVQVQVEQKISELDAFVETLKVRDRELRHTVECAKAILEAITSQATAATKGSWEVSLQVRVEIERQHVESQLAKAREVLNVVRAGRRGDGISTIEDIAEFTLLKQRTRVALAELEAAKQRREKRIVDRQSLANRHLARTKERTKADISKELAMVADGVELHKVSAQTKTLEAGVCIVDIKIRQLRWTHQNSWNTIAISETVLALDQVLQLDYGTSLRSRWMSSTFPGVTPWLFFSLATPERFYDFVGTNEDVVLSVVIAISKLSGSGSQKGRATGGVQSRSRGLSLRGWCKIRHWCELQRMPLPVAMLRAIRVAQRDLGVVSTSPWQDSLG
eukprot:TRINITY_DN14755_c0_g1_i2.p1 TRINITY_DN14755_c0_g1~~TRINITY_DN14755_c0_g1_i2.p1  ORF type:complete len:2053 (-),score=473.09 TRINITY_DN14755_c0_g1_i2:994-6915(-)